MTGIPCPRCGSKHDLLFGEQPFSVLLLYALSVADMVHDDAVILVGAVPDVHNLLSVHRLREDRRTIIEEFAVRDVGTEQDAFKIHRLRAFLFLFAREQNTHAVVLRTHVFSLHNVGVCLICV